MIDIATDNKAINWLIDKANYTDELTQEDINDGCSKFISGYFNGNLPYKMSLEVKKYINTNAKPNRGSHTLYLVDQTKDNKRESVMIMIKFGMTRKTTNKITFSIDHVIETV